MPAPPSAQPSSSRPARPPGAPPPAERGPGAGKAKAAPVNPNPTPSPRRAPGPLRPLPAPLLPGRRLSFPPRRPPAPLSAAPRAWSGIAVPRWAAAQAALGSSARAAAQGVGARRGQRRRREGSPVSAQARAASLVTESLPGRVLLSVRPLDSHRLVSDCPPLRVKASRSGHCPAEGRNSLASSTSTDPL